MTGRQCMRFKTGIICSRSGVRVTSRVVAFGLCRRFISVLWETIQESLAIVYSRCLLRHVPMHDTTNITNMIVTGTRYCICLSLHGQSSMYQTTHQSSSLNVLHRYSSLQFGVGFCHLPSTFLGST